MHGRYDKPTIYTFVFRNLRSHFSHALFFIRVVFSRAHLSERRTAATAILTDDSSWSPRVECLIKKIIISLTK